MTGWLFIQATTKRTKIDLTIVPWSLAHDVIHLTANCVNLSATSTPLTRDFSFVPFYLVPICSLFFKKDSVFASYVV